MLDDGSVYSVELLDFGGGRFFASFCEGKIAGIIGKLIKLECKK